MFITALLFWKVLHLCKLNLTLHWIIRSHYGTVEYINILEIPCLSHVKTLKFSFTEKHMQLERKKNRLFYQRNHLLLQKKMILFQMNCCVSSAKILWLMLLLFPAVETVIVMNVRNVEPLKKFILEYVNFLGKTPSNIVYFNNKIVITDKFTNEHIITFLCYFFLNSNLWVLLNMRVIHILYLHQGDFTEVL